MLTNDPVKYALLLDEIYCGNQVKCPNCGNKTLQHRFHARMEDRIGFAWFECSECDVKAHLSRVKFPEGVNFEEM